MSGGGGAPLADVAPVTHPAWSSEPPGGEKDDDGSIRKPEALGGAR
jgi:hypothetical protein